MPTITLEGDANGAPHPEPGAYAAKLLGKYTHRTISVGVGHWDRKRPRRHLPKPSPTSPTSVRRENA